MVLLKQQKEKPRTVYVAGWPCSGSTFIYQVITELDRKAIKTHGFPKKSMAGDFILFPFRDPRDIICSIARRNNEGDFTRNPGPLLMEEVKNFRKLKHIEAINVCRKLSNTLLVRYEVFFNGMEAGLIRLLADQFKISINTEEIINIFNKYSLSSNMKRAESFDSFKDWCKESLIHGNHITNKGKSGAWKNLFTPEVVSKVKQTWGDLLIQLGYENNNNWGV